MIRSYPVPPADGPLDNPLKGWAAYSDPGFRHTLPVSMAYFYRSWRELEPKPGKYAWDAWERSWDSPLARGKHVVVRLYLDYPTLPPGVPDWVRKRGIKETPYTDHGGGLSPDYDDPRLLGPLLDFIAAFGARYDKHPRVAFVALGTLGFWGEWHTWPRDALFASPATQAKVVDAYRRAFPSKIVLARYPANAATNTPWLGYHDDMLPEDTDGPEEWKFLPALRRAGRTENWKRAAVGGEMVPNAAAKYLGPEWETTRAALRKTNLSWVGPYCPAIEGNLSPEATERARRLVRAMGYEYRLTRADADLSRDGSLTLRVRGVNRGVAPFYYPWPLEVAALDAAGRVAAKTVVTADIRRWLPGPFAFDARLVLPRAAAARRGLRLAVGIRDPWNGRPRVRFANALPAGDDWTVLGPLPDA